MKLSPEGMAALEAIELECDQPMAIVPVVSPEAALAALCDIFGEDCIYLVAEEMSNESIFIELNPRAVN